MLGQEYLIGFGETIHVGSLTLEFTTLAEDSRCPLNVDLRVGRQCPDSRDRHVGPHDEVIELEHTYPSYQVRHFRGLSHRVAQVAARYSLVAAGSAGRSTRQPLFVDRASN